MLTSYTRQVTCAVTYLFSKKFVHRDLAARNVLVSDDGTCVKVYISMLEKCFQGLKVHCHGFRKNHKLEKSDIFSL